MLKEAPQGWRGLALFFGMEVSLGATPIVSISCLVMAVPSFSPPAVPWGRLSGPPGLGSEVERTQ